MKLELVTVAELVEGNTLVKFQDGIISLHKIECINSQEEVNEHLLLKAMGRELPPTRIRWYDVDGINRRVQGSELVVIAI